MSVSIVNSLDLNLDHFLKDMFYFLEIFTDSNFKFVLCINRFLKHLYKMIKMQCKIELENMVNYR